MKKVALVKWHFNCASAQSGRIWECASPRAPDILVFAGAAVQSAKGLAVCDHINRTIFQS